MTLIADLHIHSRFSRATSRDLDFVALHRSALEKGIDLVGTGDFTHPDWMDEIRSQLEPAEPGWFRLRPELARSAEEGLPPALRGEVRFVLQVEISNIYKKQDRVRKNHNMVFVPDLEAASAFTDSLAAIGNLASDGRPILGLDARDLLEMVLECHPHAFLIPAHIWTPWFSLLGSKSGFDSLEQCFGDLTEHIFAVETGLSSDPPMNWRLSALDHLTLVSNSDAHSARNLGREANILDIEHGYESLFQALKTGQGFRGTLEFFPEEGKYHLDGHRKCGVRLYPSETRDLDERCPVCGGKLVVGVMSRVQDLADHEDGRKPDSASSFQRLVPLAETVSQVVGFGPTSKKVRREMDQLEAALGPELSILRNIPLEDIQKVAGVPMAEAIRRVRAEELTIAAGFDGEFGTVRIFEPGERDHLNGQIAFLGFPESDAAASDTAAQAASAPTPNSRKRNTRQKVSTATSSPSPEDLALQLDPDQQKAAEELSGPLLVVAGPGTGKTRTLAARIWNQIQRNEVSPDQILAVTFTRQAQEELEQRITGALGGKENTGPMVTTFHGLGLKILEDLEEREPTILEPDDRLELLQAVLTNSLSRGDTHSFLAQISLAKQGIDPDTVLNADPEVHRAYRRYEAALEESGSVDLDDLVLRPFRLLQQNPAAAAHWASRFRSISVDEYQDVNDVQAALLALLCPQGKSLFVIGDPNQAIYGFRGSEPGHFLRFSSTFPIAKVFSLGTTYRLTQSILGASRGLIESLEPLSAKKHGPLVEIVSCPSPAAEAEQIVIRLEQILGGTSTFAVDSERARDAEIEDVGFGDMAILCRTKAQRGEILQALARSGLPALAVGEDEVHHPGSQEIAVMTLHASKGREFPVVFIPGVEEGLLPLQRDGKITDLDEERRLLYVGITRARHLVVLSWARGRTLWGKRLPGTPSRFLEALPSRWITHREAELPSRRRSHETQLELF